MLGELWCSERGFQNICLGRSCCSRSTVRITVIVVFGLQRSSDSQLVLNSKILLFTSVDSLNVDFTGTGAYLRL